MGQKAIVIGSGIAGLASALRLKRKGYEVQVFEANSYPGGKLHSIYSEGYEFDYGPSLFTMPHFVEELFELFGEDPTKQFEYDKKETICNYFWDDGTTFQAKARLEDFVREAAKTFDEKEDRITSYLKRSKEKYEATASVFLEKSLHRTSTYLSKGTLQSIATIGKLDLFSTLNDVNKKYFSNPKLIQLFNRYATYNGSNPYKTPGIMSLIPQLEMGFGTYYPKGGMKSISGSLYALALKHGIQFLFNQKVISVKHSGSSIQSVQTQDRSFPADLVVCNMDVFSAYQTIFRDLPQPKRVLRQERSSSALIFYWGIKKQFKQLDLHNIFFSQNYEAEFNYLFEKKELYKDPTIYINITSKEESSHAPNGGENWFVMINAPSNVGQNWEQLRVQARKQILAKLESMLGSSIEPYIETELVTDPVHIENETLSHQGSLYGTSSNSKFAAFLRHPNFSRSIDNLFFCGGSAHPGGGIPLCLLSAKIVSDLIPTAA